MKNKSISKEFKLVTKKKILHLIKTNNPLKLSLIGIQEGFIDNSTRITVYEKLLNFNLDFKLKDYETFKLNLTSELVPKNSMNLEEDVKRSFMNNKKNKKELEDNLKNTLHHFFLKNSQYTYYQGFNSICKIFITNFGLERGFCLLEIFSEFLLNEFLVTSQIGKMLCEKQKSIIKLINENTDVNFEEMHLGLFLNWLISFFSQSHSDEKIIFRIWDFLISLKYIVINNNSKTSNTNFIDYLISSILIFFIKAKSIDEYNLKENFFKILKGFDINDLKEFDFKIILNQAFRIFNSYHSNN